MHTLSTYVTAVIIVWAVLLVCIRFLRPTQFHIFAYLAAGFAIGMLAMYLAQHIYPFNPW